MPVTKSTRSEQVYRALNPLGDPFQYDSSRDNELDLIGLILWATEGDKTQISLANGNANIIKKYLEFLRIVCNLKEEKISCVIHCHDTLSYNQCLDYWSALTQIPHARFKKPFVKRDTGGTRKYPYGICRIVANNIKLVQIFMKRLEQLGLERV